MATTPRIIEAKVRRPPPQGLNRPRLSAPLTAESGPGIVVVLGPPGSGKTTLLALTAASVPVAAWCTAGPEDRSGQGFLDHVARSLSVALGCSLGRPRTAGALVDALGPPLTGTTAPPMALLVVDDVHELAGAAAESQLDALLRWRPERLRIALSTRRPLGLNIPRLQLTGDLVVLDADALRFRSWEVEELFRLFYDQPLSPEVAAALTRRTGGWAAGLKLFQLATSRKSRAEQERAVSELGGRSRLLRSYLTRTVLEELDDSTRHFLLVTSTLGTLTGPLCDALLDRSGSAAVLDGLASRQFFTTAAEDGRSYRYHQVLQTLLEGLLADEYGREGAREVYAHSARLLERAGMLADAARAFALADDPVSVAQLVQRADPHLAMAGLQMDEVPADDPWLLLAWARRQHRQGAVKAAVATYRQAESLIDDLPLRMRCAEERSRAALWLPEGAGRQMRTDRHGCWEEAVRQATVRETDPHHVEAPTLARIVQLLLSSRVREARAVIASTQRVTVTEALVTDLVAVVLDAVDRDAMPGQPADSLMSRLDEVVLGADVADRPWLARLARGMQGSLLLVREPVDWRVQSCASLVEQCGRDGDDWGAMLLAGMLGCTLTACGDARGAAWLDRTVAAATRLRAPVLECWAELFAALVSDQRQVAGGPARLAHARARARARGLADAEPLLRRVTESLTSGATRRPASSIEASLAPNHGHGAEVRFRCLGAFGIEVDGRLLELPDLRPLPRGLLMILAMHQGHDVHREVIMRWLWPEAGVDTAAHRLHTAASAARRCLAAAGLPGTAVHRRGNAYRLLIPGASFDVAVFESAAREAARCEAHGDLDEALSRSQEACELYVGDLLPEAGPEEWVIDERERLRLAAATVAYARCALELRLGTPAEALPAARRAVELDPLRDSAWVLLAETQEKMGDPRAAAATRLAHARVLGEVTAGEAGVEAAIHRIIPRSRQPGVGRAPV